MTTALLAVGRVRGRHLVNPVDIGDGADLDVRDVAGEVVTWLAAGGRRGDELALWVKDQYHRLPVERAVQSGADVGRVRVASPAAPGRILRVPEKVLRGADPARERSRCTSAEASRRPSRL